jgi:hypothetical protein
VTRVEANGTTRIGEAGFILSAEADASIHPRRHPRSQRIERGSTVGGSRRTRGRAGVPGDERA